jgi:hypothetical protein
MDRQARRLLITKVLTLFETGALVAVPMDQFFIGNTDDWSFGRHMQTSRHIPISEYAEVFRLIRARPNVEEVYVKIHEAPDDSDLVEREMWPSAFVVFVITSASATEVEAWLVPLEPRYVDANWQPEFGVAVPWAVLPSGMKVIKVELL